MVGVFRRWLGVTTLRKIKAEWRKTDVWCTISSPWYVDVVVPQIHRKWRHLATNSCDDNKHLFRKQSDLEKTWTPRCPPHHILWTSGQVRWPFSFAKLGTLLASAQSHPLVRTQRSFTVTSFSGILDSAKKVTESCEQHLPKPLFNDFPLYWLVHRDPCNGWVWAV